MRPEGMDRAQLHKEIKRVLKVCEGSVKDAAAILGMTPNTLSGLLNRRPLLSWWEPFKAQCAAERRLARHRRRYYRKKLRSLVESGYDLATAEALAAQDRRRRVGLRAPTIGEGAPTVYLPALPEEG